MGFNIRPKVHSFITDYLNDGSYHFINKDNGGRVCHIVFPHVFEENYKNIRSSFNSENLKIFLAAKSTYSKSLIRKMKKIGGGLEVSSLNELKLGIELGFEEIIAGGPKNNEYLFEAVSSGCIVSVDSFFELKKILEIGKETNILLRISNPICEDRNVAVKVSKFGIIREELDIALEIIKNSENVILRGFHFHGDGYDAEVKRGFAKYFLDLILKLRFEGFQKMDIIDIGGGFRDSQILDSREWLSFVNYIERTLNEKGSLKIWGTYSYGIRISEKGRIIGRAQAENLGVRQGICDGLKVVLESKVFEGGLSLNDFLFENKVDLIIEPGFSLSNSSGISIMDVIGVKKTSCGANLVQVDGNMFSISANMIQHISDPLLVSRSEVNNCDFKGYIVGTLCREDDFLIKREVNFNKEPVFGDKIIFFNTGAYAMSYERCNPQRMDEAVYFFAMKGENGIWVSKNDN